MAKDLFGTDGIRGVAGEYPLDPRTIFALGVALGRDAAKVQSLTAGQPQQSKSAAKWQTLTPTGPGVSGASNPEILIGADTRESSLSIAELVAGGLAGQGARVRYAGVITTPGVAYLTRSGTSVAGVMISASHNPYQDNGIKVFGHSGFKLPDPEEHSIEQEIFRLLSEGIHPSPAILVEDASLSRRYLDYLASTAGARFDGLKLAVDCGNGSAYRLAPELFRRLGAEVIAINHTPDGRNINLNCGALHVEGLRDTVLSSKADCGVAFDGDADRSIFVARSGKVVDGDAVLLAAARALKAAGRLPGNVVVATVMSNLGLERALNREGISLARTPVGDKYVLEEMQRIDALLGGEQSGHIIFREYATTGDGLLTALRLLEIARQAGAGLDELTADLEVYPQRLVNVRVREKKALTDLPSVATEIRRAEETFGDSGRVLVRFSGTEPLARVMVEGPDLAQVESLTARIADAIRREMGA
jgi:phosphoglucosamine mutase